MTRKALSKRLRFDVLERDGFTCRYCGAKPQDGALHVDHIIPVAEGGATTADNLITACEPCNTGKGRRIVGEAQPLPDLSGRTAEAEHVEAEIAAWRYAHRRRDETVEKAATQIRAEHGLTIPTDMIRKAIIEYGIAEVDHAADIVRSKSFSAADYRGATAYFFAVMRNRREAGAEPLPMPAFVDPALNVDCPLGSRLACPDGMTDCIHGGLICDVITDAFDGTATVYTAEAMFSLSCFIFDWRANPGRAFAELFQMLDDLERDE